MWTSWEIWLTWYKEIDSNIPELALQDLFTSSTRPLNAIYLQAVRIDNVGCRLNKTQRLDPTHLKQHYKIASPAPHFPFLPCWDKLQWTTVVSYTHLQLKNLDVDSPLTCVQLLPIILVALANRQAESPVQLLFEMRSALELEQAE